MKYYAEVGQNLQVVDEAELGCPDGWIEMLTIRPDGESTADYTAQSDGTWAITQETLNAKLIPIESSWRAEQMPKAQQNVTAIEYGEDGIPGTAQQWRTYWLALRKWVDGHPDYPDSTKRPTAPQ